MRTHHLKVLPPYMDLLLNGDKPFEVRRNDRLYQAGDELRLLEFDPDHGREGLPHVESRTCCLTGRELVATVTFVLDGSEDRFEVGLLPGYVVLGLRTEGAFA